MRGECLYEGAVRAGSVNRRSTRVKVRMKVHLSQLSEFTTLTYLSQDLVAADRGPPHRSRGPEVHPPLTPLTTSRYKVVDGKDE